MEQHVDLMSGIHSQNTIQTSLGRPEWEGIFDSIARENPGETVGVFFCGPPALQDVLAEQCRKHSVGPQSSSAQADEANRTEFIFFAENF